MNVTVTPAIMPAPAWTSPMVIPATAHMAGWEQTVKSVSFSASQLLYLISSFLSPRNGSWPCPAQSLSEAVLPESPCLPHLSVILLPPPPPSHSAAPTSSWVWRQPFHAMRMCRCHPEFTAAATAKNALNRDALESQHKIEALCWKCKNTHQM